MCREAEYLILDIMYLRKQKVGDQKDVSLSPEEHPDVMITREMMDAGLIVGEGRGGEDYYDLTEGDLEDVYVAMARADRSRTSESPASA